jgi:hypothetical protein
LGTAVQVRTAKVFRGRVRSGWAGSLQWNELVGFCMVWQGRKFALVGRGIGDDLVTSGEAVERRCGLDGDGCDVR